MQNIPEQKRKLRSVMRAARPALAAQSPNAANDLADLFQAHVKIESGAIIGIYRAFRDEIDPAPLAAKLHETGYPLALPLILGTHQPLSFRLYRPGDQLAPNKMGILQPLATAPAVTPDILLIPLLAFDRERRRLGYGGGYYDRTIAALRARQPLLAVGLAYDGQRIENVPVGLNDIALDKIATEVNLY